MKIYCVSQGKPEISVYAKIAVNIRLYRYTVISVCVSIYAHLTVKPPGDIYIFFGQNLVNVIKLLYNKGQGATPRIRRRRGQNVLFIPIYQYTSGYIGIFTALFAYTDISGIP